TTAPAHRGFRIWAVVGIALAIGLLAGFTGWALRRGVEPQGGGNAFRLAMPFVDRPRRQPYGISNLAISPDGLRVAYASTSRLWIQRMDQKDPVAIGGLSINPFFSPDGTWVAFFDSA